MPRSFIGTAWHRRSIRSRIIVLMTLGVVASFGILGGTSFGLLSAMRRQLLDERVRLARSIAERINDVLRSDLEILQGVAASLVFDEADQLLAGETDATREAYLRAHLLDRVFVLDVTGAAVAEQPAAAADHPLPGREMPEAAAAFDGGRPTVSRLRRDLTESGRLYAFVPARNWRGAVVALAAGEMAPAGARFSLLLRDPVTGPAATVDLVDSRGVVLASSERARVLQISEDAADVDRIGRARRADVTTSLVGGRRTVVALAPVESAPWSLLIREPETAALAPVLALRRTFLALGPALLGLALLFAWGAARSVRRSIEVLSGAAGRIARGALDQPVPPLPDDEIGQLGRSLDEMRRALRDSIHTVERANEELERRVDERTRELARLNEQLREREERRLELLRKVISAQEDERRRIARELHDETSQTVSALTMGLESSMAICPDDALRTRLAEVKALAVRTLDELHRLILDLRPSVLDDLGLLSAIRWSAERNLEPKGISVRCEFGDVEVRFAPEVETAVFRAVQEAISNIARHAHADSVLIQVAAERGRLTIEIEDDGEGFDAGGLPSPGSRQRGLGLLGMRERVELVGGTMDVDSAPGQGTRVALTVPIAPGDQP